MEAGIKNKGKTIFDFLEFRDISKQLYERTLDTVHKYDIVRCVLIDKESIKNNKRVYTLNAKDYGLSGIIFPLNEIVYTSRLYDIIIHTFRSERCSIKVDAQIFHEFYQGERIPIVVSRTALKGDPSFKLFNNIGCFIKDYGNRSEFYKQIEIGSKVLVGVTNVTEVKGLVNVFVEPIKFLENVE